MSVKTSIVMEAKNTAIMDMALEYRHEIEADYKLLTSRQLERLEAINAKAAIYAYKQNPESILALEDYLKAIKTPETVVEFVQEIVGTLTHYVSKGDNLVVQSVTAMLLKDKNVLAELDGSEQLETIKCMHAESLVATGALDEAIECVAACSSPAASLITVKSLIAHPVLSRSEKETRILCACRQVKSKASLEMFRMISLRFSTEFAFECLNECFGKSQQAVQGKDAQRMVCLKIGLALNDLSLGEDQKLDYAKVLVHAEDGGTAVTGDPEMFIREGDRCVDLADHQHALQWYQMASQEIEAPKEQSNDAQGELQALLTRRIIKAHLECNDIEKAEQLIFGVSTAGTPHGALLRFQLAMFKRQFSDALGLVSSMVKAGAPPHGTRNASKFFLSLLEYCKADKDAVEAQLVTLHILKAAIDADPDNVVLVKGLLSLLASPSANRSSVQIGSNIQSLLSAEQRIQLALNYLPIFRVEDGDQETQTLKLQITWNLGQLANTLSMHSEGTFLFTTAAHLARDDDERAVCLFFKLQSMMQMGPTIDDNECALNLEQCAALFEALKKRPRKSKRPRFDLPQIDKRIEERLGLFRVQLLVLKQDWPSIDALIQEQKQSPTINIELIVACILTTKKAVPKTTIVACLDLLVEQALMMSPNTLPNVTRLSSLYRGLASAALLADTKCSIEYFRKALHLLEHYSKRGESGWPREETLWLCVTCFNTAMLHHNWMDNKTAQDWCELSIAICHHLETEDRKAYEVKIRAGYSKILTAETCF